MTERTRNQVVAFRVTKAERRQIDMKARRSGLSQQAYLLRAALEKPICVVEELKPILAELRGWGRNLNQLTVLAHSGRVQTVYLQELTAALAKTYEAVNRLTAGKRDSGGNPPDCLGIGGAVFPRLQGTGG